MSVNHGLPLQTVEQIKSALGRFPEIEQATLYGSRALGRHRPGSDIDLSLSGSALSGTVLARIDTALDELLLPWRFDLSIREQLHSPDLIDHIERVGVPLYQRRSEESNP